MALSGWVRLGILLTLIWLLGLAGLAGFEYAAQRHGSGILLSWEQNKPKPWEIDWSKNPPLIGEVFDPDAYLRSQGMTQAQIDALPFLPVWHFERLLVLLLAVPLGAWLAAILGRRMVLWVSEGFREEQSG